MAGMDRLVSGTVVNHTEEPEFILVQWHLSQ
jgi:hypothetical protein